MREPANLGIIGEIDNIDLWFQRLEGDQFRKLAVDTETTGLHWGKDRVGGLCLSSGDTAAYFYGDALAAAALWFSDQVKKKRPLIFHNAKFDLHMLRETFGIRVPYRVDDTMIMSFLIDNRGVRYGHRLKDLAAHYVNRKAREPQERLHQTVIAAGGTRAKKDDRWEADILLAPPEIVGEYGAFDAWYTKELDEQFQLRINHWVQPDGGDYEYPSLRSLYETEQWLLLALRDMEERGIRVNTVFFEQWRDELKEKKKQIERNLWKLAGKREINWGSPKQLRELLFDKLGLEPTRFTKNDDPSTDEVSLLDLPHPIGAELLRYREVSKQLGTYAEGLLESAASWSDGRIHCNFKQTGARTGRMSCENPNLQQVPRDSGARRGFIPDEGLELRFADYSQVEMRFAAHYANDPVLVNGFINDKNFDTHAATAKKMWGLRGEPEKHQRKFAKIMNFAMLFGAGEDKVTSQLVSMLTGKEARHAIHELGYRASAAEKSIPHRTLAKLLREVYFREFATVKGAKAASEKECKRLGFTVNVHGRHRYLDSEEVYKSFNSEIQGSAGDQAKKGMVKMYRELQLRDGSIAMLLSIHDEVVYLSDGDPDVDRRALELLNDTKSFRIPIVADVSGSTTTWQDKVEIKLKKTKRAA